jgi:hypothetical protein
LEEMRQLVELAELPLGKGRIRSTADRRGVLVVLLMAAKRRRQTGVR